MIELLFIKLSLYSYILFVIEMKKNIYRIIVMTGKLSEYKYQLHCHYSSRYISLVIPRIRAGKTKRDCLIMDRADF